MRLVMRRVLGAASRAPAAIREAHVVLERGDSGSIHCAVVDLDLEPIDRLRLRGRRRSGQHDQASGSSRFEHRQYLRSLPRE